jgi:4-hydroxybenzoate polyprenyltransferase
VDGLKEDSMLTGREVQSFVRATALCGTFGPLLTGVGSATTRSSPPSVGMLSLVVVVGLAFHVYAYVLNDVIDLPIDRTEPRRAASPLVTGRVSRAAALGVALAAAIVGLALAVVFGPDGSAVVLGAAYATMAVYDVWGKRSAFPVVTDLVQGVSWAALLWWGARTVGEPTAATAWLAAGCVVFILLANGIHGSLRDLGNDLRCGARSMALVLGARPLLDGGVSVNGRCAAYAGILHVGVIVCVVAAVLSEPLSSPVTLASVAVVAVAATVLARAAWASAGDGWRMRRLGLLHLALLLLLPLVAVSRHFDAATAAVVVVAVLGPIAANSWLPTALRTVLPARPRGVS